MVDLSIVMLVYHRVYQRVESFHQVLSCRVTHSCPNFFGGLTPTDPNMHIWPGDELSDELHVLFGSISLTSTWLRLHFWRHPKKYRVAGLYTVYISIPPMLTFLYLCVFFVGIHCHFDGVKLQLTPIISSGKAMNSPYIYLGLPRGKLPLISNIPPFWVCHRNFGKHPKSNCSGCSSYLISQHLNVFNGCYLGGNHSKLM